MTKRRLLVALAVLVAAVALAACSSGGGGSGSSASGPSDTVTDPSASASPGSAEAGFQPIEGMTYEKADQSTQQKVAAKFHRSTGSKDPGYTDIDTENLFQGDQKVGYIVSLAFRPPAITTDSRFIRGVVRGFSSSGSALEPKTVDGQKIYEAKLPGLNLYITTAFKPRYVLFAYSKDQAVADRAAAAQL